MPEKKGNSPKTPKPKGWRNLLWYLLLALLAISVMTSYAGSPNAPTSVDFSTFMSQVNQGDITSVSIRTAEQAIYGTSKGGTVYQTHYFDYPGLLPELREQGIKVKVNPTDSGRMWGGIFQAFLPFILIGLLWFFIFRQAQGANNQAMSFGKSKVSAFQKSKDNTVTFNDVAGVDEAIEELREIVDYLKRPAKFKALGAKIPKGALLMGPPGTGKTLLAKAVAGEADVPFFSISGSQFVEMFVGVGASRVRDLFNQAKKSQPCIIFVDEIDAVGRQRGAGLGGGHDEREQTLNQLLVEMDGFDADHTIIVMAATNRPDILDPALLRPGRFDRQIVVDRPNLNGRLDILKIHARKKKLAKAVKLDILAKRTPGFTGADLANLMNEGALLSARRNLKSINMETLEDAVDRVMAGPKRKSRLLSKKEQEIVAYHEVGHAIVAFSLKNADPVHRVSILPRGQALGYTLQLPEEDKHLISREEIENNIKILLGGRIAEDLIFKEITSGASNDIERATALARDYVCKYGMSRNLGPRQYGRGQSQVFLGRDYSDHSKDYSDDTAREVDQEIMRIINDSYAASEKILKKEKKLLESISKLLLEVEELDATQFANLMTGKPIDAKADSNASDDKTEKISTKKSVAKPRKTTPASSKSTDASKK